MSVFWSVDMIRYVCVFWSVDMIRYMSVCSGLAGENGASDHSHNNLLNNTHDFEE